MDTMSEFEPIYTLHIELLEKTIGVYESIPAMMLKTGDPSQCKGNCVQAWANFEAVWEANMSLQACLEREITTSQAIIKNKNERHLEAMRLLNAVEC